MDADKGSTADISAHLKKARAAYYKLRKVWASGQYRRKTKLRNYKSNVMSVLLYEAECWEVELFAATSCMEQSEEVYEDYKNILWRFYCQMEIPVRLMTVGSSHLEQSEAARTDIKVWMPSVQSYVKVADVKMCRDFVSRRLMMKCAKNVKHIENEQFLHTVHGTAVCVPSLLAAIMENRQTQTGEFTLPSCCQT
ncbi:hypothetical protein LSAT2_019701 [Lamellibrachia satsuma]|nr:hypothetical protein LSAT2_019701 [Lamellibrachia satsuma]